MPRDEINATLYANRDALAKDGVKSLALFGSSARNEATPTSDIDLLVEFDRPMSLFDFLRVQERLESLLGRRVDLVMREALLPEIEQDVLEDAIHAL